MKTMYLVIVMALLALNSNAQNDYEEAIQKGLDDFKNIKLLDDFIAIANHFERVAEVETKEWLPSYYASYVYVILAFKTQEVDTKLSYLERGQLGIDKAMKITPEESEIHTLQGMWYQAYIGVDPVKNGQIYSAKASASFDNALAYNPGNPRPVYLQAISLMHTPEQYGGGQQSACPLFQKAKSMFDSFEPENELAPDWGEENCDNYIKNCGDNIATK